MNNYLEFAKSLAKEAEEIALKYFSFEVDSVWKDDDTPLTKADTEINDLVIERLNSKMKNLVKDFNVKTTRNHNYRPFKEIPFADYAFLSKEIKVNNFKVLQDEVSDHLALLLDFNN